MVGLSSGELCILLSSGELQPSLSMLPTAFVLGVNAGADDLAARLFSSASFVSTAAVEGGGDRTVLLVGRSDAAAGVSEGGSRGGGGGALCGVVERTIG